MPNTDSKKKSRSITFLIVEKNGDIKEAEIKEDVICAEELAKKCGTTKNYISRIENNASDIRLSTLMRIIREGLGGHLQLRVS